MPSQVIPITDIASVGLVADTPSVALPPNAFSEVQNVRFHDGAVHKLEGEIGLISGLSNVVYAAYWQGPTRNVFVVVVHDTSTTTATITYYDEDGDLLDSGDQPSGTMTVSSTDPGVWQHTIFNGGFHFVLNNGTSVPIFLQEDITGITPLPNWDSYKAVETTISVEWGGADFGGAVDINAAPESGVREIAVRITPRNISNNIRTGTFVVGALTIANVGTISITGDTSTFEPAAVDIRVGDLIEIFVRTIPTTTVTAGVVRAYGNLLVAGNLTETTSNSSRILPGTIRTSDVAAPGSVPQNWNPFRIGANTADEFLIAATGKVQDLAELQGVLYVYTDTSIHAVQQTNNAVIPFQISPVTDSYGADNIGAVLEFDGKHIVVGSDDIYIFAGHPGSISSIADGRVRYQEFFEREVRIVRFQKYDELWFWSPGSDQMFIWNYRTQVWSLRVMTTPLSGNLSPSNLVFATATDVYTVDSDSFTDLAAVKYESFIERQRLALTPEFDTEQLGAMALLASGAATLDISVRGSAIPGDEEGVTGGSEFTFDTDEDYKTDIRVHGRFLNYKIGETESVAWNLTGYQFDVMKGGSR